MKGWRGSNKELKERVEKPAQHSSLKPRAASGTALGFLSWTMEDYTPTSLFLPDCVSFKILYIE